MQFFSSFLVSRLILLFKLVPKNKRIKKMRKKYYLILNNKNKQKTKKQINNLED